jgi:hypothetical protein
MVTYIFLWIQDSWQNAGLPTANVWRSAKLTAVKYRRLFTALCRTSPFVECLTLGKEVVAECLSMPSVLCSINVVVAESVIPPSVALGKAPSNR